MEKDFTQCGSMLPPGFPLADEKNFYSDRAGRELRRGKFTELSCPLLPADQIE